MDDEIHPDPDAYVREGDILVVDRLAVEAICTNARRMALALYAAGTVGLLLWLWFVWKTVDALSDVDDGFSSGVNVFGDGSPTIGDYITSIGNTWNLLALAVLIGGVAATLQVVTAHVARAAGLPVGELRLGDRLPDFGDDDNDEDGADD